MPTEPQSTGGADRPPVTHVTDAPPVPSASTPSTPGTDTPSSPRTPVPSGSTPAPVKTPAPPHAENQGPDEATSDVADSPRDTSHQSGDTRPDEVDPDEIVSGGEAETPESRAVADSTPSADAGDASTDAAAEGDTASDGHEAADLSDDAGEASDSGTATAEDTDGAGTTDGADDTDADDTDADDIQADAAARADEHREPNAETDASAGNSAGAASGDQGTSGDSGDPGGGADADSTAQPDDSVQIALSAIETARSAAADGDAAGTIRALRSMPERLLLEDDETFAGVTELVATAARSAGFDDLAAAAQGATAKPNDPHALYAYGYSCVERGVSYLAVPALTRALSHVPEADTVRLELVSALEAEARNADAVRALAGSSAMEHWTGRYLLVFNCLMAGDLDGARQWYTRLGKPEDRRQETMLNRLTAMLSRVQLLTGTELLDDAQGTPEDPYAPLGASDLRGWHFALNAGVLTTLSPYGADAGMNGRYAYLAETYSSCHWALHRLKIALEAADRLPPVLGLLPDRSSRIMGIAMAELLGVQAWDWRPQTEGALVIAHSFADAAPHVLSGLSTARGQLIVEHATCWTDPPPIAADGTGLLHQVVVPPWGSRRLPSPGGDRWIDEPADDRPEREIAAEILNAPAVPDPGDGSAPPDTDDDLAYFVARIAPMWARTEGHRDRVWSPGPVHSSRFW